MHDWLRAHSALGFRGVGGSSRRDDRAGGADDLQAIAAAPGVEYQEPDLPVSLTTAGLFLRGIECAYKKCGLEIRRLAILEISPPGRLRVTFQLELIHYPLPLHGSTASHDRPDVDDLLAAGDVDAVVDVDAHVEVGAVELDAVAELQVLVAVAPL